MISKLMHSLKVVAMCMALVSAPAMASTVTINNGTSGCSYTDFSADTNGNLTINCSGGVPVSGPGTLSFSPTSVTVTEGGTVNITVARTGGSNGATSADISVATGGTAQATDYSFTTATVDFTDGDTTSKSVQFATIDNGHSSTNTVKLKLSSNANTGSANVSNGQETVNIQGSVAPPPPADGCTVKDLNWPSGLDLHTTPLQNMGNGQMYAFKIANFPSRTYVMSSINYSTVDKYITISETPCDFSTAPAAVSCAAQASNHNPILWNVSNTVANGICSLTPGKTYYFNVKNASTRTGAETCAAGQACTYYLAW